MNRNLMILDQLNFSVDAIVLLLDFSPYTLTSWTPTICPGGHFHEARAAGEFTTGLPKASMGDFQRLNSPTPTLRMQLTDESLQVQRGDSNSMFTPKARELFPSPMGGGGGASEGNQSNGLPEYLKTVFTIEHSDRWELDLKDATKTFCPKQHFVLDSYDGVYYFCNWDGKLDHVPKPHVFPLRIVPGRRPEAPSPAPTVPEPETLPGVSPSQSQQTSPPQQTLQPTTTPAPATAPPPKSTPPSPPQDAQATASIECPSPSEAPQHIPQPPTLPKAAAVATAPAPSKKCTMSPPDDQYSDGSYWKKLSLYNSTCYVFSFHDVFLFGVNHPKVFLILCPKDAAIYGASRQRQGQGNTRDHQALGNSGGSCLVFSISFLDGFIDVIAFP